MISPRTTRLLRVPDLKALHDAVAAMLSPPSLATRDMAVLVPTRGAAEELRRTIENRLTDRAILLPDILTRSDFYVQLHERLAGVPPRLTDFEREVLFRRAARKVQREDAPAPFELRAGLIVELLGFYDELRRRDKTIDTFERSMGGALEPSADVDRGAARLLTLTRFLVAAFREFDAAVASSGGLDEHGLRARVLDGAPHGAATYRHVVVTMADQAADPRGLWMADFDMLARMPGLERLDVLVTENVLASGFHERIHDALPGIEELRRGEPSPLPVLLVPEAGASEMPVRWHVARDREEELVAVARRVARARTPAARTGVVFQRPLPYLYLARRVFGDASLPWQALDALPLAAEPFAAALDLVFTFLLAEGNRASIVELLGSPHWRFPAGSRAIARPDVSAGDALLRDVKYLGGWERLASLTAVARDREAWNPAVPFLEAASLARRDLSLVIEGTSASEQVSALVTFIETYGQLPELSMPWASRHLRARAATIGALSALRDAHRRHDDGPLVLGDLVGTIRRWLEGQTFAPRTGAAGVVMLDAPAAAYADLDEVRLVGLVDSDWPERPSRSIFYPSSLLLPLGWPTDSDRLAGARARFHDLLLVARERVTASAFTLEDDAIVSPSVLLEELEPAGLPVEIMPAEEPGRVFRSEAISLEPISAQPLDADAAEWLAFRMGAGSHSTPGQSGPRASVTYAVSRVERYLECPFKYFAAHVLRLKEERDDESLLTPQERGQLLHTVFESFFRDWQARGHGTITMANVGDAMTLFAEVAERALAELPEADRALERTHLLGSAAAPGLAERAFAFEIEQGDQVIERLLEHELEGEFAFEAGERSRRVRLRAKADRIDLLADGTLRVIDYKLGKAPKAARALQLPVYGVCATQDLAGRHGRQWTLGRAGYVAFREKATFSALGASSSLQDAVREGQERFLETLDAIERGEFPVKPDEPFLCTRCGFSTVCRKDYIGDE